MQLRIHSRIDRQARHNATRQGWFGTRTRRQSMPEHDDPSKVHRGTYYFGVVRRNLNTPIVYEVGQQAPLAAERLSPRPGATSMACPPPWACPPGASTCRVHPGLLNC